MTHEELKGLVPLLALDTLPESERAEVVAHLNSCSECTELLAGHSETAAALALAPAPVRPSELLRERILREAARTPQPAAPVQLHRAGGRGVRMGTRIAAALAAAAVVAGGVVVTRELGEQRSELNEQRRLLAEQRRALDLAAASAVVVPMSFTDDFAGSEGKVLLDEGAGSAVVLLSRLRDPGDGVYTLWLMPAEGRALNLADFEPAQGLAVVSVDVKAAPTDAFAVTLEPRPGNEKAAGPVVGSAARAPQETVSA